MHEVLMYRSGKTAAATTATSVNLGVELSVIEKRPAARRYNLKPLHWSKVSRMGKYFKDMKVAAFNSKLYHGCVSKAGSEQSRM
ncbi:hypothetical protein Ccrd_004579 [Cynara cardunculus var. scolymus]|uniref:Uncharacterized protein n=1 Tax=Cynara cardunculus var. scolymus TaxID=59895 RepID=A0A103XMF2_CYNCS|nr:hypothetical protein Ccrd_004579 [Cynara cardunculus var. scolymus]